MQSNWQTNFFRGAALDAWRRFVNPENTRADADFLERALHLNPGARLLDVPCGNGRHAIELAGRGYRMTGLDQSAEFLAEARPATDLAIHWVKEDLRSVPWSFEFDGAYCMGNNFCYLPWDEARQFLNAVARCLKPGARFVVDTGMAAESILPSMPRTLSFRLGDILMLSEHRYYPSESRLDTDYTFVRGGELETRTTTSYLYTAGELCRMHAEAGLRPVQMLGSTGAEPYRIGSPRLILVSAKHEGNIPSVHETANLFRFGEFELRPGTRKVTRGGVEIPLSPRPFEVLAYLVIHAGRIVTKDELLTAIWPDSIVEEGNLSQHIFHLRKALDDPQGGAGLIRTVPGRGYEFTAPVSEVLNPSDFYTIPEQPLPTAVFQLTAAGGSL